MDPAESSRLNEQPRDSEVASSSSKCLPRNQAREQARRAELVADKSDQSVGAALRIRRTSNGRRISVGFARFVIMALMAVLTGVAASSAWDSHGGEAKQMVRAWALSVISLANEYLTQADPTAEQKGHSSAIASARDSQQAHITQNQAPTAAEMPVESVQQLKTISQDVALIRNKLEQLATAQDQMTKKMASLQAAEQEIKQKMAVPPPAPAVPTAVEPRKKASQVAAPQQSARLRVLADWWITGTRNGYVFVEGNDDVYQAAPGLPLPGLGLVKRIIRQDGRWAVVTAKGIIVSKRDRQYFDNLKELKSE